MASSVVCFSASDGAAGEEIAPLVASRLGFRVVDEHVIARAAEEAGVEQHVVAGVEQRKSLVDRMLDQFPGAGLAMGTSGLTGLPAVSAADMAPRSDSLRGMIRSAIEEIANEGAVVIVAHAASLALGTRPGVLRVFVTGSPESRRFRLAMARGIGEKEAEQLVARGDGNRAEYLKRLYKVASEQPTPYDLVVNTDRLTPEQAADVIVHAAVSD